MNELDLEKLRDEIDNIDKNIIELLAQRLDIVKHVGHYKSKKGVSIVASDREAKMLDARRKQAQQHGISPDLIESLLKRILQESYEKESGIQFQQTNPAIKNLCIIGGKGQMGQLFSRYFQRSGYTVSVIDKDDWHNADNILAEADVVVISVPIAKTVEVIQSLPKLKSDCLLLDITSTKSSPLEAMMQAHSGAVAGLHPMFGPDVKSMAKQVIVSCQGRHPQQYQWLLEQFKLWGAQIHQVSAEQHDKAMTIIQGLRHFTTYIYGLALSQEDPDLKLLLQLSSPIYRIELAMVTRLFTQSPQLYADIIFSNPQTLTLIEHYQKTLEQGIEDLKANDKDKFIARFNQAGHWFGEYSDKLLKESQDIISQMCHKQGQA